MTNTLTSAQLAERIHAERKRAGKTLQEIGDLFDVTKQRIHQAEDPRRAGHQLDTLRVRILSYLLGGVEVRGPLFEVTGQRVLFDASPGGDGAERPVSRAA